MKTTRTMLALAVVTLWLGNTYAQTIRVCDNTPNAPQGENVYPTLQAALDVADPGDIIHVVPSPTSYGNGTIPEGIHVTIYGAGNSEPRSTVGTITLQFGSSSVTKISGLSISGVTLPSSGGNNVTIEKCWINGGIAVKGFNNPEIENLVIRNCFISEPIDLLNFRDEPNSTVTALISNNFFSKGGSVQASNFAVITNIGV